MSKNEAVSVTATLLRQVGRDLVLTWMLAVGKSVRPLHSSSHMTPDDEYCRW